MIVLDTNLISEPLRRAPEPRVVAWIDAQPLETLYLSAISAAELRAGVALLPAGKRRSSLQDSLEQTILPLFAGRTLPFDLECTPAYARLMAKASKTGRAIAAADAFIPPYSPPLLLRRRQALHLRLFTRSRILTVATATIAVRSVVKIHIYRTWQRLATNGW